MILTCLKIDKNWPHFLTMEDTFATWFSKQAQNAPGAKLSASDGCNCNLSQKSKDEKTKTSTCPKKNQLAKG